MQDPLVVSDLSDPSPTMPVGAVPPVIRLRVLGAPLVSMTGPEHDDTLMLTRGFRLAVLAVLASGGERGITRDKLQAILWADSDASRASASLSQTLYGLRQDLGTPDVVRAAGPTLILDAALVQSDLRAFETAIAAGAWERAVDGYGGPFLEGFFLKDAAEFERWIDGTRTRLADMYAMALERAAESAVGRGDQALAVQLTKRRVLHDPLDGRVARRYMELLAEAGDLAGAIRHANAHADTVRAELGVDADPAVRRLAQQLREQSIRQSGPIALPAQATGTGDRQSPSSVMDALDGAPAPSASPAISPEPVSSGRRRWWQFAAAMAAVIGLLAVRQQGARAAPGTPVAAPAGPEQLAVLPFAVSDSALGFLQQGMVDLLGQQLHGGGRLRAVSPALTLQGGTKGGADSDQQALLAAAQLGVPLVLRGTVVGDRRHLVLTARLLDRRAPDQPFLASAEGPLDSLGAIVDRLAASLLVARSGEQANRVGDLSKRALAPLQAYLAGQAAYRNGRLADAVRRFREALERDPDFALAALGLARSGGFNPQGSTWRADEAGIRATEQAARLSPRDRVLFEAFVGSDPLAPTSAAKRLAEWRRAAELFPDDHEALFWYGDQFFHTGDYLTLPQARARARELFQQALQRDSLFAFPVAHLLELAAADGDRAAVERLYAHYLRLDAAEAPEAHGYISWRTAVARNDARELRTLRAAFDTMPTQSLERIVTYAQLDGGIRLEDAEMAATAMLARNEGLIRRKVTLYVAHTLYLNRGRIADSKRTLALLRAQEPITPGQIEHLVNTQVLAITDALFGDGDPGEAATAAAALEPARSPSIPTDGRERARYFAERCALELWKLRRDDRRTVAETVRLLRDAASHPDPSASFAGNPGLCAQILDTQLAYDEGRADRIEQLQRLDALMADGPQSFGGHFGNIVVARLAERSGQAALALRAVQRRRYFPADGAVYLSTLLGLEARLASVIGQRETAARAQRMLDALRPPVTSAPGR